MGAVIYGIIGAIQVNQGQDFKYWLVGDWVRSTLTAVNHVSIKAFVKYLFLDFCPACSYNATHNN